MGGGKKLKQWKAPDGKSIVRLKSRLLVDGPVVEKESVSRLAEWGMSSQEDEGGCPGRKGTALDGGGDVRTVLG